MLSVGSGSSTVELSYTLVIDQINNQSIIPSTDVIQLTFDSEDDYRTGCRNVSHCQQQQSYSGLRSPR